MKRVLKLKNRAVRAVRPQKIGFSNFFYKYINIMVHLFGLELDDYKKRIFGHCISLSFIPNIYLQFCCRKLS